MADNEIQGLSAEILGDATSLFRTIQEAETRLRAFYESARRMGPVQLGGVATGGAGGQAGGAQAGVVLREQRAPAGAVNAAGEKIGGQFMAVPAVAASPVDQAIKNNEAALAGRINASARTVAAAVTVPSQASVAPPPTTVGPAAAPVVAAPVVAVARAGETANLEQAAAQAQERAARTGRPVQYAIPGGGFRRAYPPSAGGPVGVEGGETVGGFGIPVTRGIRGPEEAGGVPSQAEIIRSLAARNAALEGGIAVPSRRRIPEVGGKTVEEVAQNLGAGRFSVPNPQYLYRAVSEEDYQGIQQRGFMKSDERMNLGPKEGTVAASTNPSFYLPGQLASNKPGTYQGRILKIQRDPREGWQEDRDSYWKTQRPIPAERIVAASPVISNRVWNGPRVRTLEQFYKDMGVTTPEEREQFRNAYASDIETRGGVEYLVQGRNNPIRQQEMTVGPANAPTPPRPTTYFGPPVGPRYGPRGITGAEEAGGAPSQEEVLRSQAARIQQLESQIAARSQAGRAGGLARAAQVAAAGPAGRTAGGRFAPIAVAAPAPVVAAAVAPTQAAAQINYPEGVTPAMMKPVAGQPIEEQALYLEALGMRQEANELRRQGRQQVGGPSGLATASAAAAGRAPARLPRVTLPEERKAVLAGSPELTAVQQQIQQAQEQVFAAVSRPTSPRVATARLVGGIFGLPDIEALKRTVTERSALLRRASEEELSLKDKLTTATDAVSAAERGEGGNVEVLKGQQKEASDAYDVARGKTEQYSKSLNEATTALDKAQAAGKTFASSFVGGVAGGLAFGAAMQIVTSAIGGVEKAVAPAVARLTNYSEVSNKVTDSLSEQVRQQHGLTDVVVASTFAQAGLSTQVGDSIEGLIKQRASIEAGNKALQDQIQLIQTFVQLRQQQSQVAAGQAVGFLQTPGAIPGISTGTGGFLNTPFGQTPGVIEQLAQLTPGGTAGQVAGAGAAGGGAGALIGGILGGLAGALTLTPFGVAAGAAGGAALGGALGFGAGTAASSTNQIPAGAIEAAATGQTRQPSLAEQFRPGQQAYSVEDLAKAKDRIDTLRYTVTQLDDAAKRASPSIAGLTHAVVGGSEASQAAIDQTAAALKLIGVPQDQIDSLRASHFAITGLSNDLNTAAKQVTTFFTTAAQGGSIPDLQQLLAQQQPAIAAQRALFRQQAEDQRRLLLPAQFGLQQLAQPTTAFGAGFTGQVPTTVGGQRLNVPAALQGGFGQGGGAFTQSFAALAPTISGVDQQIVKLQQDGQRALEALVPADQISEFRALESQIKSTGSAIAGIQTGINQEQANYQIAQYTEQLRIATRSRTDLLQLTKQEGAAQGDNLGLLERQSIELGRQSDQLSLQLSTLQLALQQRQLNFQVAVAGFAGGPGQSPEEAALRQEAAKQQAAFQQQQLDIQKQQLAIQKQQVPISFRVQDIGFSRQLTDINRQIALINRGIRVTADVAAADQAIAHLQVLENELVKRAQTYTDESTKAIAAAESATAQIAAETGNIFGDVLKQTAKAWGIFGEQAAAAYAGITGAAGQISRSTTQVPSGQYGGKTVPYQTGFIGNVGRETHMTVGEAGTETVAVLRNPRDMLVGGGGGGGGGVTIHFNGPITVGSKDDIEQLATRVGQIVTEAMARKTSMLGFRLPTGS